MRKPLPKRAMDRPTNQQKVVSRITSLLILHKILEKKIQIEFFVNKSLKNHKYLLGAKWKRIITSTYTLNFIGGPNQPHESHNFLVRKWKSFFCGIYVKKSTTDIDFFSDNNSSKSHS